MSKHFCLYSVEEEELRTTLSVHLHTLPCLSQRLACISYAMLADLQASGGSNGSSHCSGSAGITKTPSVGSWDSEPSCVHSKCFTHEPSLQLFACFCFCLSNYAKPSLVCLFKLIVYLFFLEKCLCIFFGARYYW